ncbi:MAG: hypothetical protein OEL54_04015 [Flavobacteriaceae bacterium]|nr:hypothetical protein [Flavobacteriaceae bacterium]
MSTTFSKFYDTSFLNEPQITEGVLIFDAEFSGPNLVKNGMVQLGASFWDVTRILKVDDFVVNINLGKGRTWDSFTIKNFWLAKSNLYETYQTILHNKGENEDVAMRNFIQFLQKCNKKCGGNLIMGSNRLDIDASWINLYLCNNGYMPLHLMFGKVTRLIDTSSYHQGCTHTCHEEVRTFEKSERKNYSANEAAFRHFGLLERPTVAYTHNAREDAEFVAHCHLIILAHLKIIKDPVMKPTGHPPRNTVFHSSKKKFAYYNSKE